MCSFHVTYIVNCNVDSKYYDVVTSPYVPFFITGRFNAKICLNRKKYTRSEKAFSYKIAFIIGDVVIILPTSASESRGVVYR